MGNICRKCFYAIVFIVMPCSCFGESSKAYEKLPITGLTKVTLSSGETYFIDDSRRFVFKGAIKDLWTGDDLGSNGTKSKFDLNRNNVTIEKISFSIGTGSKSETLFISPSCTQCVELVRRIRDGKWLDDYTYNIVILPVSERDKRVNEVVWCAKNKSEALFSAYIEDKRPKSAAATGDPCNVMGLDMASNASIIFGISQLPFVIDSNGDAQIGVPDKYIREM